MLCRTALSQNISVGQVGTYPASLGLMRAAHGFVCAPVFQVMVCGRYRMPRNMHVCLKQAHDAWVTASSLAPYIPGKLLSSLHNLRVWWGSWKAGCSSLLHGRALYADSCCRYYASATAISPDMPSSGPITSACYTYKPVIPPPFPPPQQTFPP